MRRSTSLLVLLMLGGCAGGTPTAEAPETQEESGASSDAEDMAADSDSTDTEDAEASEDSEESETTEDDASAASDSSESAQRLLTQEGTAFLYDFSKSDAGKQAEERCEKSSGGDAAKKANCMNKATKAVKPQGFKFERDKENPDQWWFVRFEIKGNKPIEHNRVKAEFADDSGKKITIKTQGPDKARGAKGAVPASFEIELPDQYTLIIDEPGKGKMVYEPKLGLFDEP